MFCIFKSIYLKLHLLTVMGASDIGNNCVLSLSTLFSHWINGSSSDFTLHWSFTVVPSTALWLDTNSSLNSGWRGSRSVRMVSWTALPLFWNRPNKLSDHGYKRQKKFRTLFCEDRMYPLPRGYKIHVSLPPCPPSKTHSLFLNVPTLRSQSYFLFTVLIASLLASPDLWSTPEY